MGSPPQRRAGHDAAAGLVSVHRGGDAAGQDGISRTWAGELVPRARAALAAAEAVTAAAHQASALLGGTVSFGTFSSAHRYLLTPLIVDFSRLHPDVQIEIVGLNSSEVAQAVREGDLEAGLVSLPIDAHGLTVSEPVLTDIVVCVSAEPAHTEEPVTPAQLSERRLVLSEARFRHDDPMRRRLDVLAQSAGVRIRPYIEVEFMDAALELCAEGVGDTLASSLVLRAHRVGERVTWAPVEPPFVEQFAFITRIDAELSPATRTFMDLARRHMRALQRTPEDWQREYERQRRG
ncbi:LysR family transcriptional regulator [Brevibacterium sp. 5221]|uniref:LysR family transcriptional regulator n=1 Tax=Brevibacterium rongguiense TaxID=2695267 RepID=A0A6N9HBV3_9MICO|nr:LysR family transcriptional regulator [Brevibacterium rongguiense]